MKKFTLIFALFALAFALFALVFALNQCDGAEPSRLTVSESSRPLPASYPLETFNMTDAEFFKWATDQNTEAQTKWNKWYKTAPPRWISHGVRADYEQSQRGFCLGTSSAQGSTHHYGTRCLNPNYSSKPLTIINPYCRPALFDKR